MSNMFQNHLNDAAKEIIADLLEEQAQLSSPILITGSTGLIGKALVGLFSSIASNERPMSLVLLVRDVSRAQALFGKFESSFFGIQYRLDLPDLITESSRGFSYILHLASPATPGDFAKDPLGVFDTNIDLTRDLLEISSLSSSIFVLASTMEIYGNLDLGEGVERRTIRESDFGRVDPLSPRSMYPLSKQLAENMCVQYAESRGVTSVLARLSHTYGPGYSPSDNRVQVQFFEAAKSGMQITLQSIGSLKRTYTYVVDAVSALLYVMIRGAEIGRATAYNIADESTLVSIRELALAVLESAGLEPTQLVIDIPKASNQMWSQVQETNVVDTLKLRELGWRPKTALYEGLAATMQDSRE